MAIIKYQVKENTTLGTHSFFAQAVSYSTLDISDLAEEISESIGVSPALIAAIVQRYATVAERQVMRGHRVKLGDLLTLYPQISVSVKDELDEKGNVVKAITADKFSIVGAKSSIGATLRPAEVRILGTVEACRQFRHLWHLRWRQFFLSGWRNVWRHVGR